MLAALVERDTTAAEALIDKLDLSAYRSEEKPPIDWDDADARAAWLKRIVGYSRSLLEGIDGTALVDGHVRKASSLLVKILNQDITEGVDEKPQIKEGVAPDRIVSTEDPEMRHGRKSSSKRFDGYKVHVAEDIETQLITDVEVTPGNVHDSEPVEEMLAESCERLGESPGELLGDSYYGGTDLRVAMAAHGTRVIAKLPDACNRNKGCFSKADFDSDLSAETVTCPAGHTTETYSWRREARGRRIRTYRFRADTCNACPLKAQRT